jgi:hypothetical protein
MSKRERDIQAGANTAVKARTIADVEADLTAAVEEHGRL